MFSPAQLCSTHGTQANLTFDVLLVKRIDVFCVKKHVLKLKDSKGSHAVGFTWLVSHAAA